MPIDTQLTIYNRVWELLHNYAPYMAIMGARPANEFNSASDTPGLRNSEERQAAQGTTSVRFPRIRIDVADEASNQRAPQPFNTSPANVDYGVPIRLNIDFKIIHDSQLLSNQTPLESAVRGAILGGGTSLGIGWLSDSALSGVKRGVETSTDTGGTQRTVSRFRLTVNGRPMLSLLSAS